MSGQAVVAYIADKMRMHRSGRELSDVYLEQLMEVRSSRISHWRHENSQPSYAEVKRLGEALAEHHPELRIGPYDLLQKAGYEPAPDPKMIEFEQHVHEWDEITLRFRRASRYQRRKIIREVNKLLGE